MYKMLVMDIDDTLLNSEGRVSDATIGRIRALRERGVTVTLATGRMYGSAKKIARLLDLNVPIISYQGAMVNEFPSGTQMYECPVESSTVCTVVELCEQRGLHLQLYTNDVLYVREDNEKTRAYTEMNHVPFTVVPDFSSLLNKPITKMLVYETEETVDELLAEWKYVLHDAHLTKSKPYFLEILHKDVNKGSAVAFLCQHFGYTLSDVVAMGDSWNDVEMLREAGCGVAMGNAVPALKDVADMVTATNDEDGVRQAIERLFDL